MTTFPKNLNATRIDLSDKELRDFPKEVFSYKNLRKLFLRNNKIAKIPKEIGQLKLLKVLDISNNQLTSLYANIFELDKLEVLILNNNRIKSIPSQIKKLKKLRKLGLANNKISTLNIHFKYLCNLKELNLSGNSFNEFPDIILEQKSIEKLWFCKYDFDVPEMKFLRKYLPKLKHLYVSDYTKTNILQDGDIMTIDKNKKVELKIKKLFISYSHQDVDWLERVKKHLKGLSLYGNSNFEIWDDEKILSGQNWKEEIDQALKDCSAAILLVSNDFLASDFILKEELQPLLQKAKNEGTLILQLVINPCGFKRIKSLNQFQTVNNPETQILTKLNRHEQDEILEKLVDDVERHIIG